MPPQSASAERLSGTESVLVIIVARIGDTLLATPALRALRAAVPRGRLDVLAHPERRALLEALPFIDGLGAITPRSAWYRGRLGRKRWDAAVVYGRDAPLVRYAARVAERVVAFEQPDARVDALLWKRVHEPAGPMHAVPHRLLLAEALGAASGDLRLAYLPRPDERARARQWLERQGLDTRPLIGLQAESFPTKRYRDWPLGHFIELGRRILALHPGARILVLGDRSASASAQALVREIGPRAQSTAGLFGLRQTAALMHALDLYIGVDTGPTHLAGALRVPMIAMYHCRHRGRYLAPLQHERLHVVEHPASDAECGIETSMGQISVDEVWNCAHPLLQQWQTGAA